MKPGVAFLSIAGMNIGRILVKMLGFLAVRAVATVYVACVFISITTALFTLGVPASVLTNVTAVMLWPLVANGLDTDSSFSLDGSDFVALAGGWVVAVSIASILLQPLKIRIRFRYIALLHSAVTTLLLIATLLVPARDKTGALIVLGGGIIGLASLAVTYLVHVSFNLIGTALDPNNSATLLGSTGKGANKSNK